MNKIWYILINQKEEGPFSVRELKQDKRITPDTLARKINWDQWRAIREIPELKGLFREYEPPTQTDEEEKKGADKQIAQDELVLDFGEEPPYLLWVLIALISLLYVFFRLYTS